MQPAKSSPIILKPVNVNNFVTVLDNKKLESLFTAVKIKNTANNNNNNRKS